MLEYGNVLTVTGCQAAEVVAGASKKIYILATVINNISKS